MLSMAIITVIYIFSFDMFGVANNRRSGGDSRVAFAIENFRRFLSDHLKWAVVVVWLLCLHLVISVCVALASGAKKRYWLW
jgi:hypothetical protein